MKNHSIDYSRLKPMGEDPALPGGVQGSGMITDMGLGIHYNIPRKLYAGFSVTNLLGSSAEIEGPEYQMARHYYLYAGYDINILDRKRRVPWQVTPGFLLKAAGGSVQLDLNAIVTYNDLFWGGVLFRVERAAGLMAGIKYYGIMAGVAWDYTLNSAATGGNRNSIELFVKYCYPIYPGVIKRSAYNTRNL
jgi:type IX secretion system PorP/SprF family membrane protein